MSDVAIVTYAALSALGEGRAAIDAGEPGDRARVAIARDAELAKAGLVRPFAARAMGAFEEDRAESLLARALASCARSLDAALPGWRAKRVGLVIGTSSGAMRSATRAYDALASGALLVTDRALPPSYFAPLHGAARALGLRFEPATLVLGACASSTIALGLGARWLDARACDVVLAGGFDAVSTFVAAGFEVLRATTATLPPRPFRVGRDGMALGEGAAVLALVRGEDVSHAAPRALAYVAGFGASADAVHLTAPDRSGAGLARAGASALAESRVAATDVALVSAHATATPFNDPAEARAIATILGDAALSRVVVHPMKAQIGHTLGAAGALEALACVDAIDRGVLPAAAGEGALDPECAVRLLDTCESASVGAALKLSSAFGGANAALVITRDRPRVDPAATAAIDRATYVTRAVHVAREPEDLAASLGHAPDRLARADALTRLALAAVHALAQRHGSLAGAGIVVGQSYATMETNALFQARLRERGPRMCEPRRFPYTSPNAVAGECSLVFGLTGPSFAVGAGTHAGVEALVVASRLVASRDVDRVVVVATDEVGDVVRAFEPRAESGAVALLVTADPSARATRDVARVASAIAACDFAKGFASERSDADVVSPIGHAALLPLASPTFPRSLEARSGAFFARVELA